MKYRILLIDIEVLQEGTRFPDIERADRPIIAITFYDSYTDKFLTVIQREDLEFKKEIRDNWIIVHFPTEEDMLCFVFQFLSRLDPDIIAGWNINFDITYLKNRYKTLKDNNRTLKVISEKIDSWLEERQIFDMLQAYKRVKNLPSYALGYVAEHEGLSEKTEDARDIPYLYHNELDRLIVYNYTDVKILKELEDKIGLIDFYISMKGYVGVPDINDCFYFSVLLDTVLLRIAKKRGVCLPSRRYESNEESYEGAIVFEPVPGLHRNVIVLDMAKFYPSIILTLNISPETLSDIDFSPSMDKIQIQVPEEVGLVPEMVLFLKKQREMIEEQMKKFTPGTPEYEDLSRKRQVVKDLLNAVYGFLGYEKSRIYVKKLAELVTWTARQGILWAAKRAEEMGYRAVYGDSVTGDTRVPIFTKSGKFKYIEIEKLFDHYKDKKSVKKYTTPSGKEILDVSRLKIYTIATDEFGNIKIRKIKKIIRHKVNKKIYKVRTESGKEIKVTEDHSLMVWKGDRLVPMTPKVINTDSLLYVFDADSMYDMWLRDGFEVRTDAPPKEGSQSINEGIYGNVQYREDRGDRKRQREIKESWESISKEKQTKSRREKEIQGERFRDIGEHDKRGYSKDYTGRKMSTLWEKDKTFTSTSIMETWSDNERNKREIQFITRGYKTCIDWRSERDMEQGSDSKRNDRKDGRREIFRMAKEERREDKTMDSDTRRKEGNIEGYLHSFREDAKNRNETREDINDILEYVYTIQDKKRKTNHTWEGILYNTRHYDKCTWDRNNDICRWMFLACMSNTSSRCCTKMRKSERKSGERQVSERDVEEKEYTIHKSLGTRSYRRTIEVCREDYRFDKPSPRRERITEIREIKTNKEEFVYDLEVEDCHTFLANDIFVHNTDSLLIKLDEGMSLDEVVETGKELEEKITKSFDEFAKEKLGVKKHYFALEFEKVFDPVGFFPKTKKRYFARVVWEKGEKCDYVLVRGLEVRRTDSPEITRDMQERVIEMILYGKDKKEIISYVKNIVDKIKSGQVPIKDLGIPKGIQKPILSYGGSTGVIPFHIRAAMYSNKYLGTKYDKGDKIKVLYVKKIEGLPPTDVLAFDDSIVDKLPKLTVDYDRIIDVCVRSKIEKFLELIGSSWNEIIGCKSLFSLRKNSR